MQKKMPAGEQIINQKMLMDICRLEESISLGVPVDIKEELKNAEQAAIMCALGAAGGNTSLAARLLKLKRTALHEKRRRMRL